jgi:hypothetical protein
MMPMPSPFVCVLTSGLEQGIFNTVRKL